MVPHVCDGLRSPRLYLRATTYAVSRGYAHRGKVEADGDVLTFTAICGGSTVAGEGRYRWTLKGDKLHFTMIGKDECSGRIAVLDDATYEPAG